MQNVNIKMQNLPPSSLRRARRRFRNFPFLLFFAILVAVFSILIPHQVLAWDLSTTSYDSIKFRVGLEDASSDMVFSSDGAKMYVIGSDKDNIDQYSLSVAWDISTAIYNQVSFSVAGQEITSNGLAFKSDGTKMYVVGSTNDTVYQYSLSSAWDLSTASYDSVSFSIAGQDGVPQGITFKTDGTKMYVVGSSSDTVYQYSLSSAWNLSTASYSSISFSVAGQDTIPLGLIFKSDGTKMYIVGSIGDKVYQYSLSSAWSVSSASYDSVSFSVGGQETAPGGLAFKDDGTKMYAIGSISDKVFQYSLSSAWSVSSASYDSVSLTTAGQDTSPLGVSFKDDGTKMYVLGGQNDMVYQYSLSSAWNTSTASYDAISFSVTGQDTSPQDIIFKSDGTKMYIMGATNDTVYQYSLSSAWNLSTASYDSISFSVTGQEINPTGITFKSDGTKMYIVGITNRTVYQYSLSSAWNLSAASYDNVSFSVSGQETTPNGVAFKTDGTKMYVVGSSSDTVYQYSLSSAWNLSTASYSSVSFSVAGQDTSPQGLTFKNDGTKMYMVGSTNDSVYQYSLSSSNTVPTFTSITNTSGYIKSGSTVTFTSVASDSDGSDTITLYICKANDFTGTACGAGGTWAYSSAATTNPTATYTVQSSDTDGSHTYYANIIDNNSAAATANPRSGSFTTDSTSPTINAGSDQTKTSIFTTEASASDATSGIASYLWTKQSGTGDVVFGTSTTLNTTISATDGTYIIRLTVTDTASNSSYDEFTLIRTVASPAGTASTITGYGGRAIPISSASSHSTPSFTFTPPYLFSRYLGYGDQGEDVLQLQQLLQVEGFFSGTSLRPTTSNTSLRPTTPGTITPNGIFGPTTKTSVKRFQQSRNISQTGNVGPLTQKALNVLQIQKAIQELQKFL